MITVDKGRRWVKLYQITPQHVPIRYLWVLVCAKGTSMYIFLVIFRTKSVQSGPEQSCIRAGGLKPDILNTIHQILNSTPNTATFRI